MSKQVMLDLMIRKKKSVKNRSKDLIKRRMRDKIKKARRAFRNLKLQLS